MKTQILNTLVLLFVSVFLTAAVAASGPVQDAFFTSSVVQGEPAAPMTTADSSNNQIFFYTFLQGCKGCDVRHRWYLNGSEQFDISEVPTANSYRWWTQVNPSGLTGTWTVEVVVNGRVMITRSLNVRRGDVAQQAPIQKQLTRQLDSECESRLRYFSKQAKEFPNDPYFDFMLRKWGDRCY